MILLQLCWRVSRKQVGLPAESTKQCSSSCPWQTRARPCQSFAQNPPLLPNPSSGSTEYNIFTQCYRNKDSSAPAYLILALFSVYQPSRSPSSADAGLMAVPRIKLNKHGKLTFSVTCNSLPKLLRDAPSISSFKSNLKTFLLKKSICTEDFYIHSQIHQSPGQS